MIYMDPLSNVLKLKTIVQFVVEIFGILFGMLSLDTCSNCVEIFTFSFSLKRIIFSNQKIYTDELYGSSF